ncbi:MAG: DUF2461 domain-containing protein [Campylobacterota bacterium]|nr:DUF2461 domain-containing protein [Campylobacterota bacterium]
MDFEGFSKKTLPFLESIRQNNNKEWFELHRQEYEDVILNPSRAFVQEMGEHLQALEPTINFEPKINKSLFRIYRDIRRMGANKTPLKHRIGVIFWQGNAKRLQSSSFYLHFSPEELFVSVGVRWFEKPMLDAYREYIKDAYKREELNNMLHSLMEKGYSIIDKGYKRYPRGVKADMINSHLFLYKGMATYKILEPKLIENGECFIDTLYKIYEEMLPLQQFMYEVSLRVRDE